MPTYRIRVEQTIYWDLTVKAPNEAEAEELALSEAGHKRYDPDGGSHREVVECESDDDAEPAPVSPPPAAPQPSPSLEDLCLAHRYLYYVVGRPVISDFDYDRLERMARAQCISRDSLLSRAGSDREDDYPTAIKELAAALRGPGFGA